MGINREELARDLGQFLTALRDAPVDNAPEGGRHSFYRGCHLSVYAEQIERAFAVLAGCVDIDACRAVWSEAMSTDWVSVPVWFHGDIAAGNLLALDGQLSAVIDFGTCGVGDPSCDLAFAWTYFRGGDRQQFRESVGLDRDTWRRARGWALWKAIVTMAGMSSPDPMGQQPAVLAEVLADPIDA
jgi:aminoglycoside phosphotransferase (APT) family kinase protein